MFRGLLKRGTRATNLGRKQRRRASWVVVLVAVFGVFASGCATLWGGGAEDNARIDLIAVLPVREVPGRVGADDRPTLESHAGRAVTAQMYGFLAEQTRYRFVPDLTVDAIVARLDRGDIVDVARKVAAEVQADAVLFGKVYRFQERVGPRYAASRPASVSFDLGMYAVASDEVVWEGQFDETQEALSSNLMNVWMFWRAGPHWFSVRELSRLGVESLLEDLPETIEVTPAD